MTMIEDLRRELKEIKDRSVRDQRRRNEIQELGKQLFENPSNASFKPLNHYEYGDENARRLIIQYDGVNDIVVLKEDNDIVSFHKSFTLKEFKAICEEFFKGTKELFSFEMNTNDFKR